MDAAGYRLLKLADDALSPPIADPAQALAAIQAETVASTPDVDPHVAAAIIVPTGEYGAVEAVAQIPLAWPIDPTSDKFKLITACRSAVRAFDPSLTKSIVVSDPASWGAIQNMTALFVQTGLWSSASRDALLALKVTTQQPKYPELASASPDDVVAARSQF